MDWKQTAVLLVLSAALAASEGRELGSRSRGANESSHPDPHDNDDYTEGQAVVLVQHRDMDGQDALQFGEPPSFSPYQGFQVEFTDVTKKSRVPAQRPALAPKAAPVKKPPPTSPPSPDGLAFLCHEHGFNITLPAGPLSGVRILVSKSLLPVVDADPCGSDLTEGPSHNTLIVPFSGCHVSQEAGHHVLQVLYVEESGKMDFSTVSCEISPESSKRPKMKLSGSDTPQVRSAALSKCTHTHDGALKHSAPLQVYDPPKHSHPPHPSPHYAPSPHYDPPKHSHPPHPSPHYAPSPHYDPPKHSHPPHPSPHYAPSPHYDPPKHSHPPVSSSGDGKAGCGIPRAHQVACGFGFVSSSRCVEMGCCVDSATSTCYYPMDECTADKHFVFAVPSDVASVPVDPTRLVIPGKPHCKPVLADEKVAIFKFKVDDCSTRSYQVGETLIYMVEVQSAVRALNLKFGIITRDEPIRLMVECRYPKSDSGDLPSVASVGFLVKSSSLPSVLKDDGRFGVELRIARDETFKSFFTHDHQPLKVILGKPVYLEVRLKSPKPQAVVLVHYCLAFPRSATNALVLVYEGCANPLDPNVSILRVDDLPQNRHQRRFVVTAFQFMDRLTNTYLDEEIYFMCSTEVCMPSEKHCEQRCFDGRL